MYIFDEQDQLVRKFGSSGKGNGKFLNPQGLAFDVNNLCMCLSTVIIECRRNGQLSSPSGIMVYNERLYVADHGNNCISVFQLNGQFCCIIRSGQLSNPCDVTVSGNGHLLVADYNNYCISSFTLDGAYVGKFDKEMIHNYRYPVRLTTDMHGFVLVTEDEAECVTVFGQGGVHVCSFF